MCLLPICPVYTYLSLPVPGQSSTEAGARPLCLPRLLPILPPPTTVAAATPCTPLAGEGVGVYCLQGAVNIPTVQFAGGVSTPYNMQFVRKGIS